MSSNLFSSFVNGRDFFGIAQAPDGDLFFQTIGEAGGGVSIRLRTWAGGGHNLALHQAFARLASAAVEPKQLDLASEFYKNAAPEKFRTFAFRCDDNPGSHFKLSLAKYAFGIQTGCHDLGANERAGGTSLSEGDGPVVWLGASALGHGFCDLKQILIKDRFPVAYRHLKGRHVFSFAGQG